MLKGAAGGEPPFFFFKNFFFFYFFFWGEKKKITYFHIFSASLELLKYPEHRAGSFPCDIVSDTAGEELADRRIAVRGHYDQVCPFLFGERHDLVRGVSFAKHGVHMGRAKRPELVRAAFKNSPAFVEPFLVYGIPFRRICDQVACAVPFLRDMEQYDLGPGDLAQVSRVL